MEMLHNTEIKQYKSTRMMYGMYRCPICSNIEELPTKLGNSRKSCRQPSCLQSVHQISKQNKLKPSKYLTIIKELGVVEFTTKLGVVRRERKAEFMCNTCNKVFTDIRSHGIRAKSCAACSNSHRIASNDRVASSEACRTHGMSGTKFYAVWRGMIQRCYNPNSTAYPKYGAKGITVQAGWHTFEGFARDMLGEYELLAKEIKAGLHNVGDRPSIDRTDSSLGYNMFNARWITLAENSARAGWKAVEQVDRDTGKVVARYKSVRDAQNTLVKLGLKAREDRISAVCLGHANNHAGYKWSHCSSELPLGVFDTISVKTQRAKQPTVAKLSTPKVVKPATVKYTHLQEEIVVLKLDGELVGRFKDTSTAVVELSEYKLATDHIHDVAIGTRKSHKGLVFKYGSDYDKLPTDWKPTAKGTHRPIVATNKENCKVTQYSTVREAGRSLANETGIGSEDSWRNGAKRALKRDDGVYKGYGFSYA